jgi:NAD(P)-dependent dehydrogenase (short-subunit alcohol dehydrogenase family)
MDIEASQQLQGRVAVVTGASSGLGRRFAAVLHAAGAMVIVAARRADRLAELAEELGDRVVPVGCDVSSPAEREALIQSTVEHCGRVDVLVNNAGMNRPVRAEDESIDGFREALEVNLVAPFHLAQLAGRRMLEQGEGAIVNVASMLGLVASAPVNEAAYCASKGGVVNLTRELSAQWARRGVRVNAIAPGWFESEMTQQMWSDDRSLRFVERNTPVGRHGRAHELDGVLLLLCGPGGSFIHGQTIVVDGGWTIH